MKMQHSKILKIGATLATVATILSTLPVLAAENNLQRAEPRMIADRVGTSTGKYMAPSRGNMMGSSTQYMMNRGDRSASSTQNRIENKQHRGDDMLNKRIESMNKMMGRIQDMRRISDADKSSLKAFLQTEIDSLNTLKNKINTDTSTTSLKEDTASITKSERIFALIEPRIQITAAADRVLGIVASLSTVLTKVNARLASSTQSSTTVQTIINSITSKLTDATTQANAAIAEVSVLKPDNGDKTIFAENLAALKDARTKIVAANKDLTDVRKSTEGIISTFNHGKGDIKKEIRPASTTPTTSSSTRRE